jgi:poly(hydroxyalkanoate) granule-associated protein
MANKKVPNKSHATRAQLNAGSIWLAGVGAASLARKHGAVLLGDFVAEGRRLQTEAGKFVHEARVDAQAQVRGLLTPVKTRLKQEARNVGAALEAGVSGALGRLGIPSKADIDELSQRVAALSRQLKSATKSA